MEEDIKFFGYLPNLIEISADVLLYWTFRAIDFKGNISEQDLHRYHDAICEAYKKCQSNIKEELAFHFPYADNYQQELFEEITLPNGKIGFRIVTGNNETERELLEYRLVKLEAFIRKQKPEVRKMLALADSFYRMKMLPVTYVLEQEVESKSKILKVFKDFKKKLKTDKK